LGLHGERVAQHHSVAYRLRQLDRAARVAGGARHVLAREEQAPGETLVHLREQRRVVARLLLRPRVDGRRGAAAAGVYLQASEVNEPLSPNRPGHVRGCTVEKSACALGVTGGPGIQRGVDSARGSGLALVPRG
jgi:hypothetical protein